MNMKLGMISMNSPMHEVYMNRNYSFEYISYNRNLTHIDARTLNINPDLVIMIGPSFYPGSIVYVRQCPNLSWDRDLISKLDDITIDDVVNLQLPNAFGKWNWSYLSLTIDMSEITKHLDLPWSRYDMSSNNTINIKHLKIRYPKANGKWNWKILSMSIHIDDIIKHPHFPWTDEVFRNNTVRPEHIKHISHIGTGIGNINNVSALIKYLPIDEALTFSDYSCFKNNIILNKGFTLDIGYKYNIITNNNLIGYLSYLSIKEIIAYRTFIKNMSSNNYIQNHIDRFTSIYQYFEFMNIRDPRIYLCNRKSMKNYTDIIIYINTFDSNINGGSG